MKRFLAFASLLFVVAAISVGCKEKAAVEETTTVTTPEGETTVEKSTTIEKSGENPPNP